LAPNVDLELSRVTYDTSDTAETYISCHGIRTSTAGFAAVNNPEIEINTVKPMVSADNDINAIGIAGAGGQFVKAVLYSYWDVGYCEALGYWVDSTSATEVPVAMICWGIYITYTPLQNVIAEANAQNRVVVAAIGNCTPTMPCPWPVYPAAYDFNHVIAVTATNVGGVRLPQTNWWRVNVAMVGESILAGGPLNGKLPGDVAYRPNKDYEHFKGTSAATPFVAATATFIYAADPGVANVTVPAIIKSTCIPLDNDRTGAGFVNTPAAISWTLSCARTSNPGPGDMNSDGYPNRADIFTLIDYLFDDVSLPCVDTCIGNVNGDSMLNVSDGVYLANYIFRNDDGSIVLHDGCAGSGAPEPVVTLNQNFPNPFNPLTTISYELPQATDVKLTVFNILGQEVTVLVDGYQEAGQYEVRWNSTNSYGQKVASGIYFYSIKTANLGAVKKMVLLK